MKSNGEGNPSTLTFALASLSLGVMAVTLALVCTWMTNRKRRVGSHMTNKHGSLVLGGPPSKNKRCNTISNPPRFIRSHGSSPITMNCPIHPAIIITPPTPLALVAASPFMQSDSSIGSAEDLIAGDTSSDPSSVTGTHHDNSNSNSNSNSANFNSNFCADSIDGEQNRTEKHKLKELRIKELKSSSVFKEMIEYDYRTSTQTQIRNTSTSNFVTKQEVNRSYTRSVTNYRTLPIMTAAEMTSLEHRDDVSDAVSVIIEDGIDFHGNVVSTNDVSDGFDLTSCSPRSRLGSMEPGTKRPSIFRVPAGEAY